MGCTLFIRSLEMQLYRYIGPKRIFERVKPELFGVPIRSPDDIRKWVRDTKQELIDKCVTSTFVIDATGVLLIADRHSEHVICAGGHSVRSAGEIIFRIGHTVEVAGVSNQSTGYCPEPESWSAVAAALAEANFEPIAGFTKVCEFRRCTGCQTITLVKDQVFECVVCGTELPVIYNCQD
jgi:hypothetical protein